jgi:hypothetical protein
MRTPEKIVTTSKAFLSEFIESSSVTSVFSFRAPRAAPEDGQKSRSQILTASA